MGAAQEKISIWSFGIVMGIGILALFGWLSDALSLAGKGKNSVPMAPVTIVCFILTSFSALSLMKKRFNPFPLQMVLSSVFVVCLIILFDILSGYPVEIERIIGDSPGLHYNFPMGRMSPVTCILFLISTISLLAKTTENSYSKLIIPLSTATLFVVFTFDLGYLYGTPLLYGQSIIPPAWNTSIAFSFLFIGILSGFGMNQKPLNLFIGESIRARLMRGFLPLSLLIIIIAGWVDSILIHSKYDLVIESAGITVFSLLALSFIILKVAKKIGNDIDQLFAFRKTAEEALLESEEKYRSIFEHSGVAILLTAPDGSILSVNQSASVLFGMTEAEIYRLGRKGIIDLSDPRLSVLLEERKKSGHVRGELTFIRKDGSKFEGEISSAVFIDSEAKERTTIVIRDLTEEKEAQNEIQTLNKELELKVKERTVELEQKNGDLERMNKLFVGRELRMIELKNKLKELEIRLQDTTRL